MDYFTQTWSQPTLRINVNIMCFLTFGDEWLLIFFTCVPSFMPVPLVARFKALVYGRSSVEIVGSDPTGGLDVCLL
jgi:hypothetical protein